MNHVTSLNIKSLIDLLSHSKYPHGSIVVIKFTPGKGPQILQELKKEKLTSVFIAESPDYLMPGIIVKEKDQIQNILAVFPSEWSHFHFLIEQFESLDSRVLYLFDNSLTAANYADDVIVVEYKQKKIRSKISIII